MTGYFGLMDVGQPKPGETVVVSGAAGAVGQTVGQLAKIKGCRVVGIAGGQAKCDWVVKELGFDACIDYKAGHVAVRDGLKEHCPKGVDIYFDNVGGEILDAVLAAWRAARASSSAAPSASTTTPTPVAGPEELPGLLVNRARMEGMVVFDYADRFPIAVAELAGYLKDGRMKSREDVVRGHRDLPRSAEQAVHRRKLRQAGAAGRAGLNPDVLPDSSALPRQNANRTALHDHARSRGQRAALLDGPNAAVIHPDMHLVAARTRLGRAVQVHGHDRFDHAAVAAGRAGA